VCKRKEEQTKERVRKRVCVWVVVGLVCMNKLDRKERERDNERKMRT